MQALARKFEQPDDTMRFPNGYEDLVKVDGTLVGLATFQPGWRWSECIKPVAGTERCQVDHVGYCVSGTLHVVHEDGSEADVVGGEVYRIAPGHDAWIVGDEPMVGIEFQGAANYAKPAG